jgi:acetoacetyl-CoA reductase/3-oxoacyl-[acyl-carrier protein] reductase
MSEFDGKIVVVTGAGGGIGSAISTRFAREGARVVSVDKNQAWLEDLKDSLASEGLTTQIMAVDCSDYAAVKSACEQIEKEHGRVDVLVNNCGQSAREKSDLFTDSDPAIWDFLIDTNLRTTMNWSRAVAPGMRERCAGKIVNVASESAVFGDPKLVEYGAAKAGVIGLTRGLARELAPYGININSVSPGITRTRAVMDGVPQEVVDAALAQVPRRKICEPEDMAAVIRFLASDESIGIVGQNLIVSGGRVMQ